MNENNYMGNAIEEFYRWFEILNDKFFGTDKLPIPVITVQKTRANVLGHASTTKVWTLLDDVYNDDRDERTCKYEINVSAQALNKEKNELVGIMLHEMCHVYNFCHNIRDCSGQNHNKKFKACAESHGLICTKGDRVGWGYTTVTDETKDFIENALKPKMESFVYCRLLPEKKDSDKEKPRKYQYTCPSCGKKFKSKEGTWEIMCKKCECDFEVDEIE